MEAYRYPIPCKEITLNNGRVLDFQLKIKQLKLAVFKNPLSIILWICTLISKRIGQVLSIKNNMVNMAKWITGLPRSYERKRKWQSDVVSHLQLFYDGRNWYEKCFDGRFSLNEYVKWGIEDAKCGLVWPYYGKINFIGKPMGNACPNSTIAVVVFDQDTSQLPGFISHKSGYFMNIISLKELQNITAPEPSHKQECLPMSDTGIDYLKNKFDQLSLLDRADISSKSVLKETINVKTLRTQLLKSKDQSFGIQGNENSCYMDACLFSLFAFNQALDSYIPTRTETVKDTSYFLKVVLRDIINHLRGDYFVEYSETRKLRHTLSQKYDKRFQKAFMDAEDFLLALFEGINIPSLFEYDSGYSDYIHQIMLSPSWDLSQRVESMTVQNLVENSFRASGVKLKCPPSGIFIVKLPVSNGELIPCKYVIPNLKLDFTKILHSEVCDAQPNTCGSLSAVICFRHCHYVAFSRANDKENSPWVFMDSNSITGHPKVVVLDHLDSILNGALAQNSEFPECSWEGVPNIEKSYANRLLTDAYICVYETRKPSILE